MIITTLRKVRSDAKLEQLAVAQQEQVLGWFEEGCSYDQVAALVRQHFGVSVGRSAVAAYWKRHVLPLRQLDEAEAVTAFTAMPAGDFDAATLARLKALVWTALAQPCPDTDRVVKLSAVVRKAEQQALAREEHALARERLALEKRKVAVQEKRAKAGAAEVRTTKHTKRHERSEGPEMPDRTEGAGRSAGVAGRGGSAEVAAKAPSREGRSEGPLEAVNLPRYSGYSGEKAEEVKREEAVQTQSLAKATEELGTQRTLSADTGGTETRAEVELSATYAEGREVKAGLETTKHTKDTKGTDGAAGSEGTDAAEGAGRSAGVVGRGGSAVISGAKREEFQPVLESAAFSGALQGA